MTRFSIEEHFSEVLNQDIPETFLLGDVAIYLRSNSKDVNSSISEYLNAFSTPKDSIPSSNSLSIGLLLAAAPREIQDFFRKEDQRNLTYEPMVMYRSHPYSAYEDGKSLILLNRNTKTILGWVDPESLKNSRFFTHCLFAFCIWEAMSLFQWFGIHAGSVISPHRESILIPGNSRQGKSTTALALAHAGCDFLSDDTTFLSSKGSILGFAKDLHLDPEMSQHFPKLPSLKNRPAYFELNPKRCLSPKELSESSGCRILTEHPKVDHIVFPKIRPVARSQVQTLGKTEALQEMIPPSALILIGEETSAIHLDTLKRCIEGSNCCTLTLGRDALEDPTIIAQLMQQQGYLP